MVFKFNVFSTVYKKDRAFRTIHEAVGVWTSATGYIEEREHRILSRHRRDQEGKIFQSSTVPQNRDTINHLDDYKYARKMQIEG